MKNFNINFNHPMQQILSVSEINNKCYIRYYYSEGLGQHTYKVHIIEGFSFNTIIEHIKRNRGNLQLAQINRKYWVNPKYIFDVEKKDHGSIWVKYGHKKKPYWIALAEQNYENTLAKIKRAWRLEI